ncbi:MAG: aromatic acid decarboxylase [Thermoplasmata archaeon M11B2D]|nr:MAG: aromatic acid decarboxylase [Thermoplasmata archaeon M11B2D]PNX53293.1 MAG: aromatic acid decarboxylase [Thermoplasmata archaeon M9B2D]
MRYFVSIGGASGSIYGIRLLQELNKLGHEVHLVVSEGAKKILQHETTYTYPVIKTQAHVVYENDDVYAGPASGSFHLDGMIGIPCSMKTLSAIANGFGDTLTSRAASCCLKEGRPLILVLRETPLDLPGIKNMLAAKQAGAVIVPAMPAFYHKPEKIEDLVNFIVGKVFDQLGIEHCLFKRWK